MTANNLQDAHLKTALEYAPDAELQASAEVREAVLNYAKQSTKTKPAWFVRFKGWLLKDGFANSQWAGLTGLATVLLVSILLWREHPEDIVGIGDAPAHISGNTEVPQAPHEAASDTAQKEIAVAPMTTQADAPQNRVARTEASAEPIAPPIAQAKQTSKPKSAIVSQRAQETGGQLTTRSLAEKSETDKLSKLDVASATPSSPAERAIAKNIAVPEIAAPIEVAPAPTAAATSVPTTPPAGAAQATPERATEGSVRNNQDIDFADTLPTKTRQQRTRNLEIETHLAKTLVVKGGKATANADIKAANHRLLKVVTHDDANKPDCVINRALVESIDEDSGLRVETIDVCTASAQLLKEVEIYNKTIIDWYFQYRRE